MTQPNCRLQIKRNVAQKVIEKATNDYNNQVITKINSYTIGVNFSPRFEKSKDRKQAEAIANRIADEANATFQSKSYGKVATVNYEKLNVHVELKPSERLLTAYEQKALKANNKLPNLGQLVMFNSVQGDTASNQAVTKILDTFKERFKIDYEIISPEQAQEVLKDTEEKYTNETGFYFDNKVYIVDYGNGLDWDSAIHEYGHPFMRALNKYNPNLFTSIVQQIANTPEGEQLRDEIIAAGYPENQIAEELAVRALTKLAKKNINPETGSLFEKAVDKLLKFLTSMMRDLFGKKDLKLSTLSPNTTIEELADIFSLKQGFIETKSIEVKPGVQELFDSNPELANQVYEALGFKVSNSSIALNKINNTEIGKNVTLFINNMPVEYKRVSENYFEGKQITKKQETDFINSSESVTTSIEKFIEKEGTTIRYSLDELINFYLEKLPKFQATSQQKQQALEAYSQYLDTVFPDSQVKDIVYHGTPDGRFDNFDINQVGKNTKQSTKGIYFTDSKKTADFYAEGSIDFSQFESLEEYNAVKTAKVFSAILNAKNLKLVNNPQAQDRQGDAVLRTKEKLSDKGFVGELDYAYQYIVFEPEQIHILGSKQDIEGFKKFTRNQNKPSFNRKVSQQNVSTTLDTLQSKVNEKDGMLSVDGFDNIWKRIFKTVKGKYSAAKTEKQLDAEKVRNEADIVIQNIQSDIIKKAFPLENTYVADYVETPGTKGMYDLLSKQLAPIIEKAKQRGSVMKAEIFVGNSVSSKGDIVSILEIDPEGNYYIYDLGTRYSNVSAKNKYKSLSEWTSQINQVKTILETGDSVLGLKAGKVEGAYLLELEIDYKTKGLNIKSKATYNGTNQNAINKFLKNREIKAMNIVAPKFLRTKSEKINDFIDRLYLQIDALTQKTPNTDIAKAANNALIESKLKLAQELQIEANTKNLINHVQTELEEIQNILSEADTAGLPDSSDLLSQLDVYSKIPNFIDKPTPEQRKEMLYVQGLSVQLKNEILEYERKLIQNAAEKTGITSFVSDIFAAVKDIGWFRKATMGISKIDNPLVATAFRLYTDAMGKARTSVQTLADKILEASKEYKRFTGTDDYKLIIEGNSLVGEYTPDFWKEFSKAKDNNNWEWLSENVVYNKERYLAKRENMLNFLDSQRNKNINALKIANPSISEQELTKELVELEKTEMRKWDNANKNNLSIHFTPKSKHINPKWKEIKEGKYKGTPVEAFYDLYRSVLEGANELFPEHIKSNFIPSFNQEFIEKTANLGLAGAIRASASGILDDLSTNYDENLYGEIDSATGMPIDKLFIPGLNNKENKSMDLGVVLFRFMEGVYRYKELSEVEQTILAVQRQLRNGKTKVVDSLGRELPEGKVADRNVTNNRTADAFDDWVKSSIYNQKRVDEGSFEITDKSAGGFLKLMGLIKEGDTKKISYARIADKLIRYTSLHNLAFNMYSPLVNLFGGASNMYMSGAGGLDYSNENLTKAFSYVMQGKTGISSEDAQKAKLIYEYFAIEQSDVNRDIANELSNRYLTKLTDKYNGMTLQRESENVLQRAGLIAMILSNKHSMKWNDFSVVDGKLVVEDNNMTKETFRQKVITVNSKNIGGVNPDDLASAKRYIAGRMIMQHRSWLPAMAIERFGQKQFDYVLERDVEGRYRTAVRLYKALFSKSLLEKLTPMEQANLKATRMEAMLLLGTALLVIALKGVDDDEKEKSWYKISNKISTRALGELGFFVDPTLQSQYQILLSPAASTGVLEDVGGLGKSIWKEAFGDEEEKKRAKPLKKTVKLFPLANKGYSFLEDLNVIED
jgi:hypothetical protein